VVTLVGWARDHVHFFSSLVVSDELRVLAWEIVSKGHACLVFNPVGCHPFVVVLQETVLRATTIGGVMLLMCAGM
jgi:hypothetical protein